MSWNFYDKKGLIRQDLPPDPLPIGLITPLVINSVPPTGIPTGWKLCDGQAISSEVYPELYQKIFNVEAPVVPVMFALPNLSECFIIGAGPTNAIKSTDVSPARRVHSHGGSSSTSHLHSLYHSHEYPAHTHSYSHGHRDEHQHLKGDLEVEPVSGAGFNVQVNTGTDVSIAYGPNAGADAHKHTVQGVSNAPYQDTLNTLAYKVLTSGQDSFFGSRESSSDLQSTQPFSPTIGTPASDILPPYLNVYFIIKAQDLSGS